MMRVLLMLAACGAALAQSAPRLFDESFNAPEGVSTPSLTPDGKTAYYTVARPNGGYYTHNVLVVSHLVAGKWTPPAWLEFSGENQEGNITLSPDGSRLYFWSYRSGPEVESPFQPQSDIWFVEREGAGWSKPRKAPEPVNTDKRDYTGSFAADGALYFSSLRDGGKGEGDIYMARPTTDGGFGAPENLGDATNSPDHEYAPAISPDGQTLVFASMRAGGMGGFDLYVSFKRDGVWQPAKNLGRRFNTAFYDSQPRFSPDGKRLLFTSDRTGRSQVYSVDASALAGAAAVEPHPYASAKRIPEAIPFAEGVVSTPGVGCLTWAPDGRSALLVRPGPNSVILETRFENGKWTAPETASFSGRFPEGDPLYSPDGKRVLFSSRRPIDGTQPNSGWIWAVEKTDGKWGETRLLDGRPGGRMGWQGSHASSTLDGTVYYFSGGQDACGQSDLFRTRWKDGRYQERENLGQAVNSGNREVDPYVAPDKSFLLFANDRPGGLGGQDLYVSLNRQGSWSAPRSLGPLVNSRGNEVCPSISPDGRYLFFTSDREGAPRIYQIDVGVLRLAE